MTTLLCDLGNSRLKWGLWDQGLSGCGAASYEGQENWAVALAGLERPKAVAAISVAGRRNEALTSFCWDRWGLLPRWYKTEAAGCGVRSLYCPPESLGVDRFAALVGARAHCGAAALCVIDCGTAITIDALEADGTFRGGVIVPGLVAAGVALRGAAQTLAAMDIAPPDAGAVTALGCSTEAALKGGLWIGAGGAIDRIIEEQNRELMLPLRVILTGGDALLLAPFLRSSFEIEPHLTLRGLAVMAA